MKIEENSVGAFLVDKHDIMTKLIDGKDYYVVMEKPRTFTLGAQEWLLQAGDPRGKDIIVTYKGRVQKAVGIIFWGELQ